MPTSTVEESFSAGLLEFPHYTRPTEWEGLRIPEVLLSGHHGRIAAWRRTQAERLTKERRPDLWRAYVAKATGEHPAGDPELSDAHTTAATGGQRRTTAMNLIAELEAEQIKRSGQGHPRLRRRRHGPGRLQGHRGLALARAGLRGRGDRPQQRLGHRRQLHRAQDQLRRGRRARVPAALARTSTRSPWSAAARSAGPSSTTCASAAANPPASSRRPTTAKRPRG